MLTLLVPGVGMGGGDGVFTPPASTGRVRIVTIRGSHRPRKGQLVRPAVRKRP